MEEAGEAALAGAGIAEDDGEALLGLDDELRLRQRRGVDRREEEIAVARCFRAWLANG